MITALDHVQLAMPAGEEAAAVAFYGGVLGLSRVEKPSVLAGRGGCWFEGPGLAVHLGVEANFRPARKAHPAFLVDDLDATERTLRDAGAEIDVGAQLPDSRRFHASDPFGNRLEFIQPAV